MIADEVTSLDTNAKLADNNALCPWQLWLEG